MKATAYILTFYMLLGSLFPQSDFSQLPKVIYAVKHFQEHYRQETQAGNSVSLWKFVELHFFNPNEHPRGHEQEHSQLPLHSINSAFSVVEFYFHSLPELALVKTITSIRSSDQSLDLPGFLSGIFRPPVQC